MFDLTQTLSMICTLQDLVQIVMQCITSLCQLDYAIVVILIALTPRWHYLRIDEV